MAAGACAQYVVLGAGLDSFAWRRPDLLGSLRVFEVDHPATQAWKQERVQALGLPVDDRHVLAPVDLRHERLTEGLALAGFDPAVPTLFSWLGTAFYLSVEAIETTLRAVADCAPGSEIVFDYVLTEAHWDVAGRQFMDTFRAIAADAGEPVDTLLSPTEAEALVQRCGLSVAEHLGSEDVHDRYFAARRDGLKPYTCERLMAAITRDARCSGPGTAPPARDRSGGSR